MGAIGEKIKTLRKERKLTQKELANKIGITAPTVTKYENGQLEPNLEVLNRIATTFNISISSLIEDNNSKREFYSITDFRDVLGSGEMPSDVINELTELIIIAVIRKYDLKININDIPNKDKKLIFNLASSSVKTFISDLIERKLEKN